MKNIRSSIIFANLILATTSTVFASGELEIPSYGFKPLKLAKLLPDGIYLESTSTYREISADSLKEWNMTPVELLTLINGTGTVSITVADNRIKKLIWKP